MRLRVRRSEFRAKRRLALPAFFSFLRLGSSRWIVLCVIGAYQIHIMGGKSREIDDFGSISPHGDYLNGMIEAHKHRADDASAA